MQLGDLAHLSIFLAWQLEPMEREGRNVKAPYRATGSLGHASVTDPTHRGTMAQAVTQAARLPKPLGMGGIGVVLGEVVDPGWVLVGIDFDSCRDPVGGTVAPFAEQVIMRLDSYTEVSPTGTGFHVLFLIKADALAALNINRSIWKKSGGDHPPAIELYVGGRYFTLTQIHELYGNEIREIEAEELRWLVEEHAPGWLAETQGIRGGARTGGSSDRPRDNSRSGKAIRLALELVRAGKAYDTFIPALQSNEDSSLGDWYREKGSKNKDRETKRAWTEATRMVQAAMVQESEAFTELNRRYAVIRLQDKVAILNEHVDAQGRPSFSLLSKEGFKTWIENQSVLVGLKSVPIAEIWLHSTNRRQFDGLTFRPGGAPPNFYNLWRGWAVQPSPSGSCEKFKAHLLDNVSGGDVARFKWLWGWFADMFQNPEVKPGTALVLRGNQGVGKSIVGAIFGKLLGSHYVQTGSSRFVSGQFNSHLISALMLHCDEAFWAGDKKAESILKDLVTGAEHFIERKGIDPYPVANLLRLFITGDQEWLIPAGMRERRFALYDVVENRIQDTGYFQAIIEEMEAGGYERLLHEMLTFDLAQVDLRSIPLSEALLDQKIESMTAEQSWWYEMLWNGQLPFGCEDRRSCPAAALFDHYINRTQRQGVKRRSNEVVVSKFLRRIVGKFIRSTRGTYKLNEMGDTAHGLIYGLPSLQDCRTEFIKQLKQETRWPPVGDDDDDWGKLPMPKVAF